jgi:hypothetical protein
VTARDDLAARLAEHHDIYWNDDVFRGWVCDCGTVMSHRDTYSGHDKHLADVALAWFQEQTTEEWGYRFNIHEEGRITRTMSEESTRKIAASWPDLDPKVYRRHVTAWEEA